ncbi:GLPGLI family protein [Polaribacter tangerinus]|uniref:GLPGLI family protein n=1 Tax=Polaribacter tangerinus TaxID=1920034 RepID=UPI000B4B5A96|nr:GLPGLI family protein [Polaribacter tangerinus]
MKKLFTAALIAITFFLQAQNFQGKAIYKSFTKSTFKIKESNKDAKNDKLQAQIMEQLKKMNQKTYILTFTKNESVFKQDVALKTPNPKAGGIQMISFGSGENKIMYKNLKKQQYIHQTEIMGKVFLIKDDIKNLDWEVTTETKNIGNYTCYKATYSREAEKSTMKMVNGVFDKKTEKYIKTTTAWFTPQIPVSNGPKEYGGLPGLILEINDGPTTIMCSEIQMKNDKEITISVPKKGKKISQKKFDKIKKEKDQEMLEKMKGRKGMDLGRGINVRFGG